MIRNVHRQLPGRSATEIGVGGPLLVLSMLIVLSGCATPSHHTTEAALPTFTSQPVMLLMKPDVELAELAAGGLTQPHAQWTEAGLANIEQSLADMMRKRNVAMIPYEPPNDDPARLHDHNQIIKLHRVVGATIITHKYFEPLVLPTKDEVFDWGLGPDVQKLRDDYNADYALFVYVRDSYATAGRAAEIVAVTILSVLAGGGAVPQGGTQTGFASLIDLRTGNVVWFNRLYRGTGDLRTPEPAQEAVNALMLGFPL